MLNPHKLTLKTRHGYPFQSPLKLPLSLNPCHRTLQDALKVTL